MADEKQLPENDDWLNDFNDSTEEIEAADDGQADFDQLFDSFESEGQAKSAATPPSSGGEIVEEEELDQASIDALFGDSGGGTAASPEQEEEASLDQSTIDDLLADGGGGAVAQSEAEGASLDQSTIDDLLGESGGDDFAGTGGVTGDDVFAEAGQVPDEAPLEAEEVYFEEILGADDADAEDDFSGSELDDEFDFGDELLDDSFDENEEPLQALDGTPLDDLFDEDKKTPGHRNISEDETVISSPVKDSAAAARNASLLARLAKINRTKAAIAAFVLLLLVGAAGLIMNFMAHRGNEPAILLPDQERLAVNSYGQPTGTDLQSMVNLPPEASNGAFALGADGSQVEIKLEAHDPEGAKLTYEVSALPEYGRLSGEPPLMIYQADNKFAGQDKFEFRASDGSQASQPAVISISGPDRASRLAGLVVIEPKHPVIKARNQEVAGMSTESVTIDWRDIWSQDNEGSMKNVTVEVSAEGLKGKLTRLDRYRHLYVPDPFREGLEVFKFRFKKRGVASKLRNMEIKVVSGNPPPALLVAELDKSSYLIGDTVVIDASRTRDDKRESLGFDWQQMAGVPVYFNKLNGEGSKVSFIMPSSFYTTDYPEPVIKLTAVDETGKTASREIRVKLQEASFRQASLWDGLQDARVPDPDCPSGNCPGRRLP